jgi:hypothetical protein
LFDRFIGAEVQNECRGEPRGKDCKIVEQRAEIHPNLPLVNLRSPLRIPTLRAPATGPIALRAAKLISKAFSMQRSQTERC